MMLGLDKIRIIPYKNHQTHIFKVIPNSAGDSEWGASCVSCRFIYQTLKQMTRVSNAVMVTMLRYVTYGPGGTY